MDEIEGLEPASDQWSAKMTVVIESVEHHVEEEEEEMFPKVRSEVPTRPRREELGAQLEAKKQELGAPTLADKVSMTNQELSEKAKEQDIPGPFVDEPRRVGRNRWRPTGRAPLPSSPRPRGTLPPRSLDTGPVSRADPPEFFA